MNKGLSLAVAMIGFAFVGAPAHGQIELLPTPVSTTSPPLFGVEMLPNSTSPTVTMGLAGPNAITGIQLSLIVAPDVGAVGTVGFNSVAFAATDFIFAGGNLGLNSTIGAGSLSLFAATSSTVIGGVVPGPGQSNFVDIDFAASPGAFGTFLVTAIPGSTDTVWFDSTFQEQSFNFDGSALNAPTVIGQVTVVPEPGSLILSGVALLGLAGYGLRRRLRR